MKNYSHLDQRIAGLRKEYAFGELAEKNAAKDPYTQFVKWFEAALKARVTSINAGMLATCGKNKNPAARIVLVKGFDRGGFVFYTSYESRKAREIRENARAEMVFYWPEIERQVRIFGKISKVSSAQSDAYFAARPRAAQLGAWVSRQSALIASREALDARYQKIAREFEGRKIPRPETWGGYRLSPVSYEFWQGRASRLNDRLLYKKSGKTWKRSRLQP